jgi:hypothetical protein
LDCPPGTEGHWLAQSLSDVHAVGHIPPPVVAVVAVVTAVVAVVATVVVAVVAVVVPPVSL